MKVKVHAKLNLTLNVLGKQNGFHNIDSVATSVDVFDVVTVLPRADYAVTVTGVDQVAPQQNTAYRAACAFMRQFGTYGADIKVEKGIPLGAGMGGSSADAAAVVYCMCRLFNVDVNCAEIHFLCSQIGSDVNFMLFGGLGRLCGKGDDVIFGELGSQLHFALTTFDTSISAAEAYAQFDRMRIEQTQVDNCTLMKDLQKGCAQDVSLRFNNQLQAATISLSGYAADYLDFCAKQGLPTHMTGSGSAYFIAFNSEQCAQDTADLLKAYGFTTTVCHSVNNGVENI